MIRNALAVLILIPLAALIVLLAVANREPVNLSLDPFMSEPRLLAVTMPLYIVILAALITGVLVGGVAAWLRQGKWRRHVRHTHTEIRALRAEHEALRARLDARDRSGPPLPSIAYRRPPAA